MRADLEALEAAIGHEFRHRDLLVRALTHTSHAYENSQPLPDNEQLEFLGDSILGFLISESLVSRYPSYREGPLVDLQKLPGERVASLRCGAAHRLGEFLLLGRGEELSGGRIKKGLLADAVEALIAAIHLDAGIDGARHVRGVHVMGAEKDLPRRRARRSRISRALCRRRHAL